VVVAVVKMVRANSPEAFVKSRVLYSCLFDISPTDRIWRVSSGCVAVDRLAARAKASKSATERERDWRGFSQVFSHSMSPDPVPSNCHGSRQKKEGGGGCVEQRSGV
jgi:hypothetical protein